jgi:small subunit ribosomal protein S2
MNAQISLMDLFKLGAHRGNRKARLNSRLKHHVYGQKDGLSLVDLTKLQLTLSSVEELLEKLGAARKQILFVGTATHLKSLTKETASKTSSGMPYIENRWLGGTLTNWGTVRKTLKTLEKNEKIMGNEKFFNELARNERLGITRETDKLLKIFGGLKEMKTNRPGALIILDAQNNGTAIKEADVMGVPVIALLNTATTELPQSLNYTLVCNNNSKAFVELIADRLADAYNRGLNTATETEVNTITQ